MTLAEKEYRRLPGRGNSGHVIATRHKLWLGQDHLLAVATQAYTESYRRFSFKDIQAITVRKTWPAFAWNIVLGTLLVILSSIFTIGVFANWDIAGTITLGSFAGFILLFLLINLVKGPSCICHLKTAVQTERLYSLHRIKKALKVIKLIEEQVAAVQGALSEEDRTRYSAAVETAALQAAVETPGNEAVSATVPPRHCDGLTHLVLFLVLIVSMVIGALAFLIQSPNMVGLVVLMLIALISTLVTALLKQSDTDLPAPIKMFTWTILLYLVMEITAYIVVGAVYLVALIQNTEYSPMHSPVYLAWKTLSLLFSGIIGVIGLSRVIQFRKAHNMPPEIR